MFSRFFVRRPVFAWVIAILIMLAGVLAIRTLPVGQYPDVAPPAVKISATYTGASAETLENSVTQVIEQQLTGLDHLLYFSSTSSSDGSVSITVTFEQGTDPDTAQVQVQNKVQQAESRLPSEVQQSGVTVEKSQSSFLLILAVYDKTNRATSSDISDWLVSNLQDPLARVEGVGSLQVFGAEYAMRVWMDPTKLASYSLMPSDVQSAIEAQNVQVSAGKIGALPSSSAQQLTATVRAQSRLQTPDQFKAIIVKSQADGSVVRLSDVARVEMGSEDYRYRQSERPSGRRDRGDDGPRRQRAGYRDPGEKQDRRIPASDAAGIRYRLSEGQHRVHQNLGRGRDSDPVRSDYPRRLRDVSVPAELPRDAHSGGGGAGGAAWHLWGAGAVRLLD